MRKIVLLSGVFALAFSSVATAQSSDVVVDLSVLDGLGTPSMSSSSQPLFPVVKKAPKRVAQKPKPKKVVKPATPKVVVEERATIVEDAFAPSEPETDIIIPAKEDIKTLDVPVENNPFATETLPVEKDKISAAPVASIAVEDTTPEAAPKAESILPPKENVIETTPEVVVETPSETIVETPAPVTNDANLFDNTAPTAAAVLSNKILFATDSTELTESDKKILDALVASFEDTNANKIGIFAYNYDNGVDSFRKKRQCLNRAIEVRSYLLGKGYKNFSIKVVNTTDDKTKENLVELEELK